MTLSYWVILAASLWTSGKSNFQIPQPVSDKRGLTHKSEDACGSNSRTLPKLADQFEVRVEATIIQRGRTLDIVEYYDYTNARSVVQKTEEGLSTIWINNFRNHVSHIIQNDTCITTDLTKATFNILNLTQDGQYAHAHIRSIGDLFNVQSSYDQFGTHKTHVRGIPVEHWTSCVGHGGLSDLFHFDYYYSAPNHSMPAAMGQVPVRVDLQTISHEAAGHEEPKMEHIYDIVFYRPGPIRDPSVFEIPKGIVCRQQMADSQTRPKLPDSFSMSVEVIQPYSSAFTINKQYFDYKAGLSRTDMRPNLKGQDNYGKRFGYRPLQVIHDYNSGFQYIIDTLRGNCTTESIPEDAFDAKHMSGHPHHIFMKHGFELFNFQNLQFSYQGKRTFRGIPCTLWSTVVVNEEVKTTIEAFYLQDDWSSEVNDKDLHGVLVGLWFKSSDTERTLDEWTSHIYDFVAEEPVITTFDVLTCYTANEMQHFRLTLQGSYNELVTNKLNHITRAVRKDLAFAAGLELLRISDIYFDAVSPTSIHVWFTILDKPSIQEDRAVRYPVRDKTTAVHSLKVIVDGANGLIINVAYLDGHKQIKVEPGSLKTDDEAMDPRRSTSYCTIVEGYTGGAMGGLAFAMILVGLVVGVGGAALWLARRNLSVPYRIND